MGLDLLIIGIAGATGAVVRYLSYIVGKSAVPDFPSYVITSIINILGCLLIGIIMTLVERAVPFHRHLFLMGAVGFLGSFTTFSTFGFETFTLLQTGQAGWAILNGVAQVLFGVVAVWVGRMLVQFLA